MSSLEVSNIDLEIGTVTGNHRRGSSFAGSDVSDSSCDSEFHSAVRSLCGELEIVDSDTEPSGSAGVSPEKDCRICHMGLESSRHECGAPMALGCSCKDDLGYVHKHCAETWFKIKGNKTCEICRSIARNFSRSYEMGQANGHGSDVEAEGAAGGSAAAADSEDRRFWRGHRFLNFILTCMVSAFVISWFFHFNLPSQ